MKMKNLAIAFTLALGTFAAPHAAQADGDIAEIRPYLDERANVDEELVSGQKFQFVVRLAARDQMEPATWEPIYLGASEALKWMYMPKLGIVVSGKMRYADLVSWAPNEKQGSRFTDLIFEYQVQPGDFARPVMLALKGSTELKPIVPSEQTPGGSQTYFLKNVDGIDPASPLFRFCDDLGNVCSFSYREDVTELASFWPEGEQNRDPDLAGSKNHYMVKSIDFDDKNDELGFWRVVTAGETTTLQYQPKVATIGVADTNSAPVSSTRLYIWSDNELAVSLEKAPGAVRRDLYIPDADGHKPSEPQRRWVYEFNLITGQREYNFPLYGNPEGEGETAHIVLSGSAEYKYDTAGSVITNFLMTALPVKCGPKPPPSIKLTWDLTDAGGVYPDTVQAFTNELEDINAKGYQMCVTLSGDRAKFGETVTLDLLPTLASSTNEIVLADLTYVYTNKLIATAVGRPGDVPDTFDEYTLPKMTKITFEKGESTKRVWIYPIGSLSKATTKGDSYQFRVAFAEGTDPAIVSEIGNDGACTLKVTDPKPALLSPSATDEFSSDSPIPVRVVDCYRDLSAPRTYSVKVTTSSGTVLYNSTGVQFRQGDEATEITLDQNAVSSLMQDNPRAVQIQVKVTDPQGQSATSPLFTLNIPAKEVRPSVSAVLYDTTAEVSRHVGSEFAEGATPYVRFVLDDKNRGGTHDTDLFAFLEPGDETTSNLVNNGSIKVNLPTAGVRIPANETNSVLAAANSIQLLDGTLDTQSVCFKIVLKSGSGNVDTVYQPLDLLFSVVNVYPETLGLYINGSPAPVKDGETFGVTVSSGVDQDFTASYKDVSSIDVTSGVVTVWCFTDSKGSNTYKYSATTSTTDSVTCKHTFVYAGGADQKVMFIPVDKDMLKSLMGDTPLKTEADLKALWPRLQNLPSEKKMDFNVTVHVGDSPHINVTPEELTIFENTKATDAIANKVALSLSQAYEADLWLRVDIKPLESSSAAPGHATFATSVLHVKAGEVDPVKNTDYNNGLKFVYADLDGTADSAEYGFYVTAEAYTSETAAQKKDASLKLTMFTKGESYVYVKNVPPTISPAEPAVVTTNKTLAVNQDFKIDWKATDVMMDVTNRTGLVAKWYIDDNLQNDKTVTIRTNMVNMISTYLKFTSDGAHEVRLEVEDKEGENVDGKAIRRWYYYIAPTKTLEVRAFGPSSTTKTKYTTVAGLGEGRVWADGIKGTEEDFAQTWTYSITKSDGTAHAYGYPAAKKPYYDDGTLKDSGNHGGRDIAIDKNGDSFLGSFTQSQCYRVSGEYDNFFYVWAYLTPSEGGGAATVTYDAPQPTAQPTADVSTGVTLDEYEENKDSYAKMRVEAIFSRELYAADNMGDINADGIPDLYLKRYGLGIMDTGSGELTGDDIKPISSTYNGNLDEDYLPSTDTAMFGQLIPGLADTWATVGKPFTARLEIRGYHDGLNDAPAIVGGIKARPDRVYEITNDMNVATWDENLCTISYPEYLAWKDSGLPPDKWSPERPTDPTEADTDDDGFPDGYEYFFWYRAHVGYMVGDTHVYLTGRRYNPENPMGTNVISSVEIEKLFDPLTSYGDASESKVRDTDNDGLPDLLEFELGTNPVDWDTDGDGLPDGYEIEISETDPLLYATDKVTCDGDLNTDHDWMADLEVKDVMLFGLDDGKGGVDYYHCDKAELNDLVVTNAPFATEVTLITNVVKTANGLTNEVYVTTFDPVTWRDAGTNGEVALTCDLPASKTWRLETEEVEIDGEKQLFYVAGEPVSFGRGKIFLGVTTNAEISIDCPIVTKVKMELHDRTYNIANDEFRYWKVWVYGRYLTVNSDPKKASNLVEGKEYNHASLQNLTKRAVRLKCEKRIIHRLHYHAYQDGGFDPRTGWKGTKSFKTASFTHLDEFYTMTFFIQDGVLSVPVPTRVNTWAQIWKDNSTSPISCDTDNDAMPDGWELYLMGGPKVYETDAKKPNYHERICDYGPQSKYSPLFDFNKLVAQEDRDNDKDGIEWPEEYTGVESGQQYDGELGGESITAFRQTWADKKWFNKKQPTDPWNKDTDGDGLSDGEECFKNFIYTEMSIDEVSLSDAIPGGGLNPLSWDTDGDYLPDPWEAEFPGEMVAGGSTSTTNTTTTVAGGSTNTVASSSSTKDAGHWEGGMDGTVSDAMLDYDNDGLDNWQEYLTGAIRAWRYDDTVSPWDNLVASTYYEMPSPNSPEWDDWWYARLVDEQSEDYNPHFVSGYYDNGASWFSQCTNAWDAVKGKWYMFKDGVYHDLQFPSDRYIYGEGDDKQIFNRFTRRVYEKMGIPMEFWITGDGKDFRIYPKIYICCNPTMADTDFDGMDDYYELFHGMNPLLGAEEVEGVGLPRDLVYESYTKGAMYAPPMWSAKNNFWTCTRKMAARVKHPNPNDEDDVENIMDFELFPWLNGLAHADPDGDNIINQLEGIMPGMQAASSYLHTDPTPLWMTDFGYGQSLTYRYYQDPLTMSQLWPGVTKDGFIHVNPNGETNYYKFADFPLLAYDEKKAMLTIGGYSLNFWGVGSYNFWSFEENEGYDSDHDYLSDYEEGQGKTKLASDPTDFDDPMRRQAMYFDGVDSFLQTPLLSEEVAPSTIHSSSPPQAFLYYTVECWAKPDDVDASKGLQTLVERAIQADSQNPGDEMYTRKNFVLGLKNGRWYTRFDSTGSDMNQPVEIVDGPQATTNWTHLAATYDGTALRLYVNGECSNVKNTSVKPECGICAIGFSISAAPATTNSASAEVGSELSYGFIRYSAISILVGASARNYHGVVMDYNPVVNPLARSTDFSDYNCYYKGYVDEVRIWDGARSAEDIRNDYLNLVRYDAMLAKANRDAVFNSWRKGADRSPLSSAELPAELRYHFSFDHIPGAVRASDVMKTPAGFNAAANVVDAKAIWSRPVGWVSPWWAHTIGIHSQIYTDYAWVPWIANTVAHLSRFDGTTLDSFYWSEDYAGRIPAQSAGFGPKFAFPREHEVYSKWMQMYYAGKPGTTHSRADFLDEIGDEDALMAYQFTLRNSYCFGNDLLPMGHAYPRRISMAEGGMWDDEGPADAWAQTGKDVDNNGLPDWWQAYARANYCKGLDPRVSLDWDTTVTYDGIEMPAYQAYLRDLTKGMLPGGRIEDDYADIRDVDRDGLPDWWEELNHVQRNSSDDMLQDPDNDGLNNYVEYLISEVFMYARLDPNNSMSDGCCLDYFRKMGDFYFGEIFTDHDQIDDLWEDAHSAFEETRYKFDPFDDDDGNGWDHYSEYMAQISGRSANTVVGAASNLVVSSQIVRTFKIDDPDLRIFNATNTAEIALEERYYSVSGWRPIENGMPVGSAMGIEERVRYTLVIKKPLCMYDGHPTPTIDVTLRFPRAAFTTVTNASIVIEAYSSGADVPDATWKTMIPAADIARGSAKLTLKLADKGYVRQGANKFVCYAEGILTTTTTTTSSSGSSSSTSTDSDGFQPGVPFGVVSDVDVGWDSAKFTIELSNTSAITPRIALWSDINDRDMTLDDVVAAGLTDRTVAPYLLDTLSNRVNTAQLPTEGKSTHIRVVRYGIDDMFCYNAGVGTTAGVYDQFVVLDKTFDPDGRDYLCEADFLGDGQFDIDWNTLSGSSFRDGAVVSESGVPLGGATTGPRGAGCEVTNMTYLVVIGDGKKDFRGSTDSNEQVRALSTVVTRRFERTRHAPTINEPINAIIYSARPTFKWSIPNEEAWAKAFGCSYTAFKLQILESDGTTVVYDSGVRRAPAVDADGLFSWEAPVYAGCQTVSGTVIDPLKTYKWQVTMYNAKFRSDSWSAKGSFTFDVNRQQEVNDHGYSSIGVVVKYTGPAKVLEKAADLSTAIGTVRVQAFTTADFSGEPVAEGFATEDLADVTQGTANATLFGLPQIGTYYIRAFIDSDGDGVKSDFESWGCAKASLALDTSDKIRQTISLYIEDADTDGDWLPDAWEYAMAGWSKTWDEVKDKRYAQLAGDSVIAVTDNLKAALDSGKLKTGISNLPGASLTTFQNTNFAALLLGLNTENRSTFDAIRAAVRTRIAPNTLKINSLELKESKVVMTVGADVTLEVEEGVPTGIYDLGSLATVQFKIYRKNTLLDAEWTPVTIVTKTFATGEAKIEVSLDGLGINFSEGFYKVEVVQ